MNYCFGVLVPPDYDEPRCFVQERELTEEPWDGAFKMSVDHFYPRSLVGDDPDNPTHLVHRYDQMVQGGMIQGPARVLNMTFEERSRMGKIGGPIGGRATTPEQHRRAGQATTRETHSRGGKTRAHTRWHRDRGLTNPDCDFCREAVAGL